MALNEHAEKVMSWLNKSGARDVHLSVNGRKKHPRILFVWHGKSRFFVVPSTVGDSLRGYKNSISSLRHQLGLVGQPKASPGSR